MHIDIWCSEGSPTGVIPEDIYGKGVGGAELALLSLSEAFVRRGHTVNIYNDPRSTDKYDKGVRFKAREEYNHASNREALIVFRGPLPSPDQLQHSNGHKVFWSCDQYTVGNYRTDILPFVDDVVVISEFHRRYFADHYGCNPTVVGLGVRVEDYEQVGKVERVKNQLLFCSVPERGLDILYNMWKKIKQDVPDVSLVITSDYRLWGVGEPRNERHRLMWMGEPNVRFLGLVPRHDLVRIQLESDVQAYPCTYDELFCISTAECQVAGAVPFTSTVGALCTTNMYGVQFPGNPTDSAWQHEYVDALVRFLTSSRDHLEEHRDLCRSTAKAEFNWDIIAMAWESVLQ